MAAEYERIFISQSHSYVGVRVKKTTNKAKHCMNPGEKLVTMAEDVYFCYSIMSF